MTEPDIRLAREADLPGILTLYGYLHPDEPPPEATAAEAAWSDLLSSGVTMPFVADIAGMLVASCTLAIIPNLTRGARPYGVIENVVTHGEYRRTGLARAVLRTAIERAWSANCYKVMFATGSRREATLSFYEAVGFQRGSKTYFEIRRP